MSKKITITQTKEISDSLNILIANQGVLSQKLKSFHWEVEGPHFIEYHKLFEELYDFFTESIDTIAERIRFYSLTPLRSFKDMLGSSGITENNKNQSAENMISTLILDFEILLKFYYESLELAESLDSITEDMLIGIISDIEKNLWILRSLNKN
jgi:starvation-inducible DNA-binding protein